MDETSGDLEWGTRVVSAGFAVDLDAAILVDRMSRAHLVHTRAAILTGQRPDGGGAQAELGVQAASVPDRQSPFRGYRTGELADGLRRSAIESNGREASCKVLPPVSRNTYVGKERRQGRELLTLRGAAGQVVEAAARAAVAEMVSGLEVERKAGEVDAKDAER